MICLNPPRILIVKLSSLGDLFHALPVVHVLKEELATEIDWVTQPEYAELVQHFDDIQNVFCFPRKNLLRQIIPFFRKLRKTRYDMVIDLQGLIKSAVVTVAAHGKKKIGPSGVREGVRGFYHAVAGKKNKERHAAEELLDVVHYLGLSFTGPLCFPVTFPVQANLGPGLHIAFSPLSRAIGKNWPVERFIEIAHKLQKEIDCTFHLVGESSNQSQCKAITAAIGTNAINHAGKTTLIELGSLLQKMDLLIAVDSGPMHMAAAIGTPVLALFGPTSPLRTGPYGQCHHVIESSFQTDKKKISKKTRQQDLRYMEAISTKEVFAVAYEIIRKGQKK